MYHILSVLGACLSLTVAQEFSPPTPPQGTQVNTIPQIGLGTARIAGNTSEVIASAIVNGFRHIDCAYNYGNQKDVGVGIKEGLKRTGLKREDLWITSKLAGDRHGLEEQNIGEVLDQLQLDYLDLFLVHWPMGNTTGTYIYDHVNVWKAMEKLVRPKRGTRFIGISNHSPEQVDEIMEIATIRPKIHQFELHPYLQQTAWVEQNFKMNITVVGYAPLGNTNPTHTLAVSGARGAKQPLLLTNKVIKAIAEERSCSPAQVVLAWNMRRNVVVVPKASQIGHQLENIATAYSCNIEESDMQKVADLKVALRLYPNACPYGLTEGC